MTPEKDLHYTLIQYLDYRVRPELSNIIKHSRIVYDKQWEFTRVVSDQLKLHINIKTPLIYKSILENELDFVKSLCFEIYEDDDEYMATSVGVSILASGVTTVEINQIEQKIISGTMGTEQFCRDCIKFCVKTNKSSTKVVNDIKLITEWRIFL